MASHRLPSLSLTPLETPSDGAGGVGSAAGLLTIPCVVEVERVESIELFPDVLSTKDDQGGRG
jgi:hypothetical protein